ncbi:MAG TPA: hypothetical protein VHW60_04365 [Caulobacteraceae bacterium]|nr:hypothetical protein [Caulobacteraceae bacterium]
MTSLPTATFDDEAAAAAAYQASEWTDGLPVALPTAERVQALLDYVGRDPAEVLLVVPETKREVNVGLAAVNAVMAGCRPEYFPVVLAAIEGWADDRWGFGDRNFFYMSNSSTGGGAQLVLVNGPIRHEIGLNSGANVYSGASPANLTIGRALRLIVRNVIGMRPGVLDHASQGHPGKLSYTIAENEEESPWAPLHVERGFSADQSTAMVFCGRAPEPVENRVAGSAEAILFTIADTMSRLGAMLGFRNSTMVVMGPEHAGIIGGKHGWSKADVKQYLFENFRRTVADMARAGMDPATLRGSPAVVTEGGVEWVRGCRGPGDVILVVAGGNNAGVSSVVTNWAFPIPLGDYIIKPIAGPAGKAKS